MRAKSLYRWPPAPAPDLEVKFYYAGLPSYPVLVARTESNRWDVPIEYIRPKELRVAGKHKITEVWEDDLALKVNAILLEKEVDWTSTDVVRIAYFDEPSPGDVILWIGVRPDSLSHEVGLEVVLQCKVLLLGYGIEDVDVEIRESEVTLSAGPQLLEPSFSTNPTVDVRRCLTATLGIPICSQSMPWAEGTGGFFLSGGGGSKRLFLVTARHVVFPPHKDNNDLFERQSDSQARHDVLVLSDVSFQQHLASIKTKIDEEEFLIEDYQDYIEELTGKDDGKAQKQCEYAQNKLAKAKESLIALNAFHHELSTHWATEQSRVLGHVVFSPPVVIAGTEQYIQDVAVIDIDSSKIDPNNFRGNVIDLGTEIPPYDLIAMMCGRNLRDSHSFKYPVRDRLLRLRGTISDDEMHRPTTYDDDNDPCIMVLKRGMATGLTVGRANTVFSYTRTDYFGNNDFQVSKAWAILPFDQSSGAFSAKGDSGAVVVDGVGRIGGVLSSGGGKTDNFDITYATPISFVLKTIHGNKSLANAFPRAGPSN